MTINECIEKLKLCKGWPEAIEFAIEKLQELEKEAESDDDQKM